MELKNETLLFGGIMLVILGSLVIIFDYPQIRFLEMAGSDSDRMPDMVTRDIQQRLLVEFSVGVGLVVAGTALLAASSLKGFKNRFGK